MCNLPPTTHQAALDQRPPIPMQLFQAFLMATILYVAALNAKTPSGQYESEYEEPNSTESSLDHNPAAKGFDLKNVEFSTSNQEENVNDTSSNYTLLVAGGGACACFGLFGVLYMKRRKQNDKLPGEIFTIDDKNSVL